MIVALHDGKKVAIVSSLAKRARLHETQAKSGLPGGFNKPGIDDEEELYLPDQVKTLDGFLGIRLSPFGTPVLSGLIDRWEIIN